MAKKLTPLQLFLREEDQDIIDFVDKIEKGKLSEWVRQAIREKMAREK